MYISFFIYIDINIYVYIYTYMDIYIYMYERKLDKIDTIAFNCFFSNNRKIVILNNTREFVPSLVRVRDSMLTRSVPHGQGMRLP